MRSLVAAAIMLAASPAAAQDKELLFDAPAAASDADRIKAAKTLAARCVAAGLKDVVGDLYRPSATEPKRIRLKSEQRFWSENFPLLDFLASFQARTVEIRFERVVKSSERRTYKEGEKAPEGHSWVKVPEWEFVEKPFQHYRRKEASRSLLFPDKPKNIPGPFKVIRHPGGPLFGVEADPNTFLLFKGPQAVELNSRSVRDPDDPQSMIIPLRLFIDDALLSVDNGMMFWRFVDTKGGSKPDMAFWKFDGLDPKLPLAWLLENPLPFELKRVK